MVKQIIGQTGKVLVVGSISFDIIFAIHGNIKNELPLKNGQLDKINLMFTAKNKTSYYGGTAGNISYGLGILGNSPILFSVAGNDFSIEYEKHLQRLNVKSNVIKKEGFTAVYYGISDEAYQQIGIWQPNAYENYIDEVSLLDSIDTKELSELKYAIFSPGTGISTRNHMLNLKQHNPSCVQVFDPSQVLSIFYTKDLLYECLNLSDIVIGNETEIAQFKTLFNLTFPDIFSNGVEIIIETLGDQGCKIHTKDKTTSIDRIKPRKIIETTGAGDAFRAGFLHGLSQGLSLEKSAKIGTFMGARNVEEYGGQVYTIDPREIDDLISKT